MGIEYNSDDVAVRLLRANRDTAGIIDDMLTINPRSEMSSVFAFSIDDLIADCRLEEIEDIQAVKRLAVAVIAEMNKANAEKRTPSADEGVAHA